MRAQELQWGQAARCQSPLLTLLGASQPGRVHECRRLGAHPEAITSLALHLPGDGGGPPTVLRCGQLPSRAAPCQPWCGK